LAISWHFQIDLAGVGDDVLVYVPVPAVADPAVSHEMMIHLGIERLFGQRLLQLA